MYPHRLQSVCMLSQQRSQYYTITSKDNVLHVNDNTITITLVQNKHIDVKKKDASQTTCNLYNCFNCDNYTSAITEDRPVCIWSE